MLWRKLYTDRIRMERGFCAECGRICAIRPPRGGDGSMCVPVYHRNMNSGSTPCVGIHKPATPLSETKGT